ncbi:hypothetical protein OG21DRAFT_1523325 [Imleria badia]|nr:hypothetical protein OG21DRAFT_1523325 [Imleria badia]
MYALVELLSEHACDNGTLRSPMPTSFLLLIKAIIVFMAGEHDDAISRMDDLINTVHLNPAYTHLLLGKLRMESRHYEGAIRSFERAQAQMPPHTSQVLLVVSLMYDTFHDAQNAMKSAFDMGASHSDTNGVCSAIEWLSVAF